MLVDEGAKADAADATSAQISSFIVNDIATLRGYNNSDEEVWDGSGRPVVVWKLEVLRVEEAKIAVLRNDCFVKSENISSCTHQTHLDTQYALQMENTD